jgi:hypothetical protein
MYLGTIYIHAKFWPDRTSNMAARRLVAILENKLGAVAPDLYGCIIISPELMAGSAPSEDITECLGF